MGQIYSLNLLAKIATIKGNASLADAYFNRALQLSAKNNFTRDMLRLYREIFESKLQLNDANAALNYFKLWDKLNDSLQTSQQNEAITKYQVLYETQKKDMSIRLLEEENEQRRIRAQLSGIVFIAAILTFIILIYFARLHEKHARNKLFLAEEKQKVQQLELNNQELILKNAQQDSAVARQELQAQQRLLVSKMLILSHNNEFLANLLRNLQALNQKTDESASGKQLIDTLKLIKNEIQPGRWDEFEKLYHESHAGFYQKLNEHHPGLTPGEHRLCAMLRMDLSIKEISLLTLQSNRAVEMARHRLRTKLGIEREDNLTAYLSQF
jgi:hypothetical protein